MKLSDNHNHIIKAPIESMVEAAIKRKVSCYSITEHISQFEAPRATIPFRSVHTSSRMFRDFAEYRAEFGKVEVPKGFDLRKGLEVDYVPSHEAKIAAFVAEEKWDKLLCSVHELSDGKDVERGFLPRESSTYARRWKDYFDMERRALESDFVPFDVLTHPVRLVAGTPGYPDEEMDNMLLDLATVAKKEGRALELNGRDFDLDAKLVGKLAHACKRANCQVSLGSDAHIPNRVFKNLDKAVKLVQKLDLDVRI